MSPTSPPSNDPTALPTTTPSAPPKPTASPTVSPVSCELIYVKIDNFDILSSDGIKHHHSLQTLWSNFTYFGIVDNLGKLKIDENQFYVDFRNISEPLSMIQTLCAFGSSTLENLILIISSKAEGISNSMEMRLRNHYDLPENDILNVVIGTEPIEFRFCTILMLDESAYHE